MISENKSLEDIAKIVTGDKNIVMLENDLDIKYECDCSKDKFEKALISIGKEELSKILEEDGKAETVCHFCNKKYYFFKRRFREFIKKYVKGDMQMTKKFEKQAMFKENPKWRQAISRMEEMYNPIYGDAPMRSELDRDYTRIINCKGYRRLKHKTQVFFSPKNDHICTRIEHVNLVESISNTVANYLGLNSELTKAIAVAHDIGHSPFGHQGEKILSQIAQREYGKKILAWL